MRLNGKDVDITMAAGADSDAVDNSLLARVARQADKLKTSAQSPWVSRIGIGVCSLLAVALISRCIPEEEFDVADRIIQTLQTGDNNNLPDPDVRISETNEAQREVLIDIFRKAKKDALRLSEKAGYKKTDTAIDDRIYDMFQRTLKAELAKSELPINMREDALVVSMWQIGAIKSDFPVRQKQSPTRITSF